MTSNTIFLCSWGGFSGSFYPQKLWATLIVIHPYTNLYLSEVVFWFIFIYKTELAWCNCDFWGTCNKSSIGGQRSSSWKRVALLLKVGHPSLENGSSLPQILEICLPENRKLYLEKWIYTNKETSGYR